MNASTSTPTSRTVDLPGGLSLAIDEYGVNADGSAVLLLHGGAGSRSIAGLAAALSEQTYVIAPTHPGFDGTPRPEWFDSMADLATAYLDLLDSLALTLLNSVGIFVDGAKVVDPRGIAPAEVSKLSFANPAFRPRLPLIAGVGYGRAYADSFPNGHFVPVPDAGHFPHIEQAGRTLAAHRRLRRHRREAGRGECRADRRPAVTRVDSHR
ncbi:MAG: alpha/beta fold hydrolase [Actinoallomurus sp.]